MKYLKRKNYFSIFTILFIVISIVLSTLSLGVAQYKHHKIETETNKIRSGLELKVKVEKFKNIYSSYENVLFAIANNKLFTQYLDDPKKGKFYIDNLFEASIAQNKNIMQLRYLDEKGDEKIRFDKTKIDSNPFQIATDKLQNKANRYYFSDTMKLEKKEVYTSKLDLNIENGKIEKPYKSVLRIATPVFYNNEKKGILIVNIFMENLLKEIVDSDLFNIYVFDQDNYMISTNDTKYENFSRYLSKKRYEDIAYDAISNMVLFNNKANEVLFIGANKKADISIFDRIDEIFIIMLSIVLPLSLILGYTISRIPKVLFDNLEEQHQIMSKQSRLLAMAEMIEALAHQWRQPLNAVAILTQEIKLNYKMKTLDQEKMEELNVEIQNYLDNMSTVIDDFRNFFKPNSKKELIDIQESLQKTLEVVAPKMEENFIDIELNFVNKTQLDNPFSIQCLENEIKQLILSIIYNAIEVIILHNPKNKVIDIEVIREKEEIQISVTDRAGGIDVKIAEKIFEPYFTTKQNELQGAGLGLYYAKMIIEKSMKGKISFENTEDGVRFELIIPTTD